jgi:hypothetical protein
MVLVWMRRVTVIMLLMVHVVTGQVATEKEVRAAKLVKAAEGTEVEKSAWVAETEKSVWVDRAV